MSSPPAAAAQPVTSSPTASPNTTSSTPQYDAPTGPPPPQPAPTDPKVAELLIMFPSVDVGVIEMILESVGGSQDRAIETLLSMTDPEFKPDDRHVRTEEEVGWMMMRAKCSLSTIWMRNSRGLSLCKMNKTRMRDADNRACRTSPEYDEAGLSKEMINSARIVKVDIRVDNRGSMVLRASTETNKGPRILLA